MRIERIIVGRLETNCYLVINDKELAIIDPGDEIQKVLTTISKENITLKFIINTHYHFDHTYYSLEIKKIMGGEILFHRAEQDYIDYKADQLLDDGDKVKIGQIILKVVHTPGHTSGSICLLGGNFIFTGDTLFKDGCGRTDLPGGSDQAIQKSLEKLAKIIKPGMIIYPGHGNIFKT
jgi:glyoxylase-like metal-dependent hydrolase (beta-lactamase superfamily II)